MLQEYIQMVKPQKQEIEISAVSDETRKRLETIFGNAKERACSTIIAKRNQGESDDGGN
jgi:hypothetical protein